MNEREMHHFSMFFRRMPGEWWIIENTLKHWITHRKLKMFPGEPSIALSCSKQQLQQYCTGNGVIFQDGVLNFGYQKIMVKYNQELNNNIVASEDEKAILKRRNELTNNGLWQQNIIDTMPYVIQIPFKFGTVMDNWQKLWWKDNAHSDLENIQVWFTKERKIRAYELLNIMYDCGERAGIREAIWIGFGCLLGYVVCGDVLPHDTDLDICIDMEMTTPEKDRQYIEEIQKPFKIGKQTFPNGLTEKMFRYSNKRDDTDRPLWISIGHRSIERDNGVKSCNWWMFKHSGYYWHSKGDRWVTAGKFNQSQINNNDKAICLGQPSGTLETFEEVNFHGVAVNMPTNAGACLDWWYPGWFPGGKGASAKRKVMAIADWKNKSTWRVLE